MCIEQLKTKLATHLAFGLVQLKQILRHQAGRWI
jgi:hypothetical protein